LTSPIKTIATRHMVHIMRKVIKEEKITFPEIQVFKSVSQTPKIVMERIYLPSA
jgi:hypothetical protein